MPILQASKCPPPPMPRVIRRQADGQMWQECGRPRHETGNPPPIDRPMIYRARRMPRLEIRPSGRSPRGYFSSARKGGRGGAGPDPHTNHSRNFRLEDPPHGQIFWEKILEIKIVLLASPRRGCYASSRSDSAAIGLVLHRWSTPQRLLPRPPASLRIYSARRLARHACQPSISCSWRRSSL